jgi:hypothetical protein
MFYLLSKTRVVSGIDWCTFSMGQKLVEICFRVSSLWNIYCNKRANSVVVIERLALGQFGAT